MLHSECTVCGRDAHRLMYCSKKCSQKAYRERRKGRANKLAEKVMNQLVNDMGMDSQAVQSCAKLEGKLTNAQIELVGQALYDVVCGYQAKITIQKMQGNKLVNIASDTLKEILHAQTSVG